MLRTPRSSSSTLLTDVSSLTFSYPGWEADKAEAEELFTRSYAEWVCRSLVQDKVKAMRSKQKIHEGERRSIPELRALDDAVFTYPGWQDDKKEAEEVLIGPGTGFEFVFSMMKRKQAMHSDRSSLDCLRTLDSSVFTYPGWEADKAEAEGLLTQKYVEWVCLSLVQDKVKAMRNKQVVHEGERRSIPELRALDDAVFTYPGWQDDKKEAEEVLIGPGTGFEFVFDMMNRKQAMHSDRSSLDCLRTLDSSVFTYPGWEADKAEAEGLLTQKYVEWVCLSLVQDKVKAMRSKQADHEGERRSVPGLRALDDAIFTYPGWQVDKKEAEETLTGPGTGFKDMFDMMNRKQAMHIDRSRLRPLDSFGNAEDSPKSTTASPTIEVDAEEQQDEEKDKSSKCTVCWESEASHAYIPCGHRCICGSCASRMEKQKGLKCLLCREDAICLTRIYL